jgi:hypothetical protein
MYSTKCKNRVHLCTSGDDKDLNLHLMIRTVIRKGRNMNRIRRIHGPGAGKMGHRLAAAMLGNSENELTGIITPIARAGKLKQGRLSCEHSCKECD